MLFQTTFFLPVNNEYTNNKLKPHISPQCVFGLPQTVALLSAPQEDPSGCSTVTCLRKKKRSSYFLSLLDTVCCPYQETDELVFIILWHISTFSLPREHMEWCFFSLFRQICRYVVFILYIFSDNTQHNTN